MCGFGAGIAAGCVLLLPGAAPKRTLHSNSSTPCSDTLRGTSIPAQSARYSCSGTLRSTSARSKAHTAWTVKPSSTLQRHRAPAPAPPSSSTGLATHCSGTSSTPRSLSDRHCSCTPKRTLQQHPAAHQHATCSGAATLQRNLQTSSTSTRKQHPAAASCNSALQRHPAAAPSASMPARKRTPPAATPGSGNNMLFPKGRHAITPILEVRTPIASLSGEKWGKKDAGTWLQQVSQSHIRHECSPLRWAISCKHEIALLQ